MTTPNQEAVETPDEDELDPPVADDDDSDAPLSAFDLPAAPRAPLDVRWIPVDEIQLRRNIRHYHDIEGLAETMHLEGQLEPCVVRPTPADADHQKPFELIFGHRRKAAAEMMGWEELRCEVRPIEDDRTLRQMIIENFQREQLSAVEEARTMYELKYSQDPPLSNAEVARDLGCDPSHVSHRLKLLSLAAPTPPTTSSPASASSDDASETMDDLSLAEELAGDEPETQSPADPDAPPTPAVPERIDILGLVDEGRINASTAEVIASLEDSDDQQQLTKLVLRNDWSTKKAASWARQVKEHALDEGGEEMGPVEWVTIDDVTELSRLRVRPLSEGDVARITLYALLRNGMDREMLDYLHERMGYSYEQLWDYIALLDDAQVKELTERLCVRYLSAAHRWYDMEPTLKDEFGLPEDAGDDEVAAASKQAEVVLPIDEEGA